MAHYHPKRILQPGPVVFDPVGIELLAHEREMLAHPATGAVILFGHNFEEPQQLADLIRCCREARSGELLVMVDQEGGRVQRFRTGFSALPSAAVFGEAFDVDSKRAVAAAEDVAWLCGRELRVIGVDINLAPVADLQTGSKAIGDRAYHTNPGVTTQLSAAAVRGLHCSGLSATAKHFPGHGGVLEDTHVDHACDERELAEITEKDLSVFKQLIEVGVDSVMPAHVVYPAVDECPAGYSPKWIKDLLRTEMGFEGAVLSDDLSMAAAGIAGEVPERAEMALSAGCDLALVCQDPGAAESVIDRLSGDVVDETRAERVLGLMRDAEEVDERLRLDRAMLSLDWLKQPNPDL